MSTVVRLHSSGKGVSMPNRQSESYSARLGFNDWIGIREAHGTRILAYLNLTF